MHVLVIRNSPMVDQENGGSLIAPQSCSMEERVSGSCIDSICTRASLDETSSKGVTMLSSVFRCEVGRV